MKWLYGAVVGAVLLAGLSWGAPGVTVIFRRGASADWTAANPTLQNGEPGYETDTGLLKMGNGLSPWLSLPYSATFHLNSSVSNYAAKAGALLNTGTRCSAGQAPLGIDASGNAVGCFTPPGTTAINTSQGYSGATVQTVCAYGCTFVAMSSACKQTGPVEIFTPLNAVQSNISSASGATCNAPVNIHPGGSLGNTTTLRFGGPFTAGNYQVFTGSGNVVFGVGSTSEVYPEWFGAIPTAYGVTTYAATNLTAINQAIASLSGKSGKLKFGNGWYYVSDVILVTTSGMILEGSSSTATSLTPGTHIATTSTTADVIRVDDTVLAVEGFDMRNIIVFGLSSGTTGNCLTVKASHANAIAKITIKDCTFIGAAQYGILFDADTSGSFIFNCYMSNNMTRGNKLDGLQITGQCSQFQIDSLYTESNTNHGVSLIGGTTGGTNNIMFNRLTLSEVPVGYAGLDVEYADAVTVLSIYSESVAGDNIRLRSVRYFTAIGGAIQQAISTSYGVVIGNDAANHPNKNHYIDIPGWVNTSTQKHIDLTRYATGVVVDGLVLGQTSDGPITNSMINGYNTTFHLNQIKFLYTSYNTPPTIAVQPAAGTGATATLVAGSTDKAGQFVLTHGSGSWATGAQVRITFAVPFAVAPIVLVGANDNTPYAGNQVSFNAVGIDATTTYFDMGFGVAGAAAGAGYWSYMVVSP